MGLTLGRVLIVIGIVLLVIFIGLIFLIFFTGPPLPEGTDAAIDKVMSSDLPELVTGDTGYVTSDGYKIWYESISPKTEKKGTFLLCMGMGADALEWPPHFVGNLKEAGYQVIRFDYRGTGMSDWTLDWKKQLYSLFDLVNDTELILEALNVSDVHLVGLSMGGMVVQEFAIKNKDRTLSLNIIMSSGDTEDKDLPGVSGRTAINALKVGIKYGLIKSEQNSVKLMLGVRLILRGDAVYDIDVPEVTERVLYNARKRKGYNPNVSSQHNAAAKLSRPRYERLKKLDVPTLIIHGKNDPLVPIEHGEKLADVIPNAKSRWFDNMGHDLPPNLIDPITAEILKNVEGN